MGMTLKNDLLLRALLRQPVDRTPVWMMRQAGRYLPEYRATRARAGSFLKLCMTPELACEVTLQPLARYPLDAAILFSDILTIPHALGLGLQFETGEGPRIERPVRTRADVAKLGVPDPNIELRYVMDAVRLIRRELDGRVPLIGFAGSPWTVATYIVEGGSSREFSRIKGLHVRRARDAAFAADAARRLDDGVLECADCRRCAGGDAVRHLGRRADAALSIASSRCSRCSESWPACGARTKAAACRSSCSRRTAVRGSKRWRARAATRWAWTGRPISATRAAPSRTAWRCRAISTRTALYASPQVIRTQVARVLASYGRGHGHVFNLGHGIHPAIDPEHAGAMIAAVHELSPPYHVGQALA